MSAPPFDGPIFKLDLPPRSRLPLVVGMVASLLIAYVLAILWRVTTPDPTPEQPRSVPAPAVQTVIVIATNTPTFTPAPTNTPYVIYKAATSTPTPALILCDVADDGAVCVRLPPSPTATPLPPLCHELTPASYQVQTCRKGEGYTSAKGETE